MKKFKVTGMSCAACVSHVELAVKKVLSEEDEFTVSLLTNSVSILLKDDGRNVRELEEALSAAIKNAGYSLLTNKEKSGEIIPPASNVKQVQAETDAEVYLIKGYQEHVIKQKLVTTHNKNGESMTHSEDTYYLRNYETDRQFERFFNTRVNKEGRRVPSDTQTKHYRFN